MGSSAQNTRPTRARQVFPGAESRQDGANHPTPHTACAFSVKHHDVVPPQLCRSIDSKEVVQQNQQTKLCVKEEPQATLFSLTPSPRPDPDPEWSPGASPAPGPDRPRKKYARTNPPRPPTGPYPTEKKERKKAQNRTAA